MIRFTFWQHLDPNVKIDLSSFQIDKDQNKSPSNLWHEYRTRHENRGIRTQIELDMLEKMVQISIT